VFYDFISSLNNIFLKVSQKLYGRTEQVRELTESFEQVIQGTVPHTLLLVSGYSGVPSIFKIRINIITPWLQVGKTTLVNEIQKPVVTQHGYFCCGKCEQFKVSSPYAAFIQV
jgi:predicted ATPase